jgi:hypothetical protein
MDSSFNSFSKVVTKHVMGSQDRFNELKERLEMCEHATSKAGAAALGYLIAMEEKENGDCPWEEVRDLIDASLDSATTTDEVMVVIYQWLDKKLEDEGYDKVNFIRTLLQSWFEMYMP